MMLPESKKIQKTKLSSTIKGFVRNTKTQPSSLFDLKNETKRRKNTFEFKITPNNISLPGLLTPTKSKMPSIEEEKLTPLSIETYNFTLKKKTSTLLKSPENISFLISACSKKLKEEPNNLKALYIRASSNMKKGKFNKVLEDCNELLSLENNHIGGYYLRGCVKEKLNFVDSAIEDYTTVIKKDPLHVNAIFARAACFNKKVIFFLIF